jgi:hypothetical protein
VVLNQQENILISLGRGMNHKLGTGFFVYKRIISVEYQYFSQRESRLL